MSIKIPKISIFLLFWILVILGIAEGIFEFGCMQGYYQQDERCLACDSSCKTCTSPTSCSTCEQFMYLDPSSQFCSHCGPEEFYDYTLKVCRDCEGTCEGECGFRQQCFQCEEGELLDLEEGRCVEGCEEGKMEVRSGKMSFGAVCREEGIYIDHFSTEVVELGTLRYPYRTIKSAASEISYPLHKGDISRNCYLLCT